MTIPLRVGIIGLGRRWQKRYRPALLGLPERFEVRAVCDGITQLAINEAHRLGCAAAAGPTQLAESADIDVVLLLDPPWYRLWPLEAACRARKPVFCCASPDLDELHADELNRRVQEGRILVMLEMALRFAPATLRLRELLETRLGPARIILGEVVQPAREPDGRGPASPADSLRGLLGPRGVGLLDWCAVILGGAPQSVRAEGAPDGGPLTVSLDFGDRRTAQLTRWDVPGARPSLRLRVIAKGGSAALTPPLRLSWSDAEGRHRLALRPREGLGQMVLKRFHRVLTEGGDPQPDLASACQALGWLRAAARSRAEDRRLALPENRTL